MNSNDSQPNKLCSATLMRFFCNRLLCFEERSRVPYVFAIFVNTPSTELSILINIENCRRVRIGGGGRGEPSVSSSSALAVSKKLSVEIQNSPLSLADI